jgi:hypothetical protein
MAAFTFSICIVVRLNPRFVDIHCKPIGQQAQALAEATQPFCGERTEV